MPSSDHEKVKELNRILFCMLIFINHHCHCNIQTSSPYMNHSCIQIEIVIIIFRRYILFRQVSALQWSAQHCSSIGKDSAATLLFQTASDLFQRLQQFLLKWNSLTTLIRERGKKTARGDDISTIARNCFYVNIWLSVLCL